MINSDRMKKDIDKTLSETVKKPINPEDFEIGNSTIEEIREEAKKRYQKRYPGWTYVPGAGNPNEIGRGGYGLWAVKIDRAAKGCLGDELREKYQIIDVDGKPMAKNYDDVVKIKKEAEDFIKNKDDKAMKSFLRLHNLVVPEEVSHSLGLKRRKQSTHYQFFKNFVALEPKINTIYIG